MIRVLLAFLIHLASGPVLGVPMNSTCAYIDYLGNEFNIDDVPCEQHAVCQKTFTLSYIHFPPYFSRGMVDEEVWINASSPMQKPLHQRLRRCCGKCATLKDGIVFNTIADVSLAAISSSDFIYPFFASSSTKMLYGYHYLPLVDIPKLMFITNFKKGDIGKIIIRVLPITLICVLIASIAGFVCWLLETWTNEKEFSRPFLTGWFEGFWWSFVSMTTVGYGDKTPRSFVGRIFAVLWISIGIIAYGLLTGVVYSEVAEVNSPPPPKMQNARVGCLLYRDYDAFMVAEKGGQVHQNEDLKALTRRKCKKKNTTPEKCDLMKQSIFTIDAVKLLNRLKVNDIDGLVLDQYTLWALTNTVSGRRNTGEEPLHGENDITALRDFLQSTVTTPIEYSGAQQFTYGALVKHHEDYEFFKDFFKDSRLRERAWISIYWSYYKKFVTREDKSNTLFSHSGETFQTALISIVAVIGMIILIGVISDLIRTKFNIRRVIFPERRQQYEV